MIYVKMLMTLLMICLIGGCQSRIVKQDLLTVKTDSPALIVDGKGQLLVSYWSEESNSLIEYGWVDASDFDGWTLTVYDWQAYKSRRDGKIQSNKDPRTVIVENRLNN